ncbi:MAG: PASTA domain-containing protein [Bacteroidota bacterium]
MNFFRFLISKQFLRHLGLAFALALILLLITLTGLRIYTHHGQAILVPDLAGLTVDEVDDVTSSRNLRFEIVDSVFSSEMPRGTVIKQNPKASSRVKENRKIFLTMNAINPEMVAMPQLVGLSIRQARLALQNGGLILGQISYRPDFAVDNVLQQMHSDSVITEGSEIRKGEVIDLVLGMVSRETTKLPDLIGLGLESARKTIADYRLNVGAITYDESMTNEEDSAMSFVWRQYPEQDEFKRINKGMELDIWLTIDSTLLPGTDTLLYE